MAGTEPFAINLNAYQSNKFSAEWLSEIYSRNWFKLFLPKKLGGLELSLPDGIEQIRLASSFHGSLGWCVNLGSGASYFYRFLSEAVAHKIFIDEKSVIAGSGQPTGKAFKTDGGFLVTGTWDKCSGSAHATAFTGNAVFEDGKVHSLVFFKDQVQLSETWNMFAMKATSSQSYSVTNAFVPEEFVFDIGQIRQDDTYPIAEIPFDIFARFCMIATLIGTVECFLNHLEMEFQSKIRNFEKDFQNLKRKLESDKSSLLELAGRYWSVAETKSPFTEHHQLNLGAGISLMSRSLYDAVCDLFYKTGISLADETCVSHHAFRDVLMASQHSIMKH